MGGNAMIYLAPAEIARRLGVSVRTVKRIIARGEFGPVLVLSANAVRVSEEAVQAWIEARCVKVGRLAA